LLKLRQELLGVGQGRTKMLKPFCLLLQDSNILDGGLAIVVSMDDEWSGEPPVVPPVSLGPRRVIRGILPECGL
jgi:hypothetical protein